MHVVCKLVTGVLPHDGRKEGREGGREGGNGPNAALSLTHTSVYWGPVGLPEVREV